MANFSEVVDELKENNQQTAALVSLQQQEIAVETAAGGAASASAKQTEKSREGERSQNRILASLQSISTGIKSLSSNFGEMLKDKAKQVGGDIFSMLKKFAFGVAVAGVLAFLNSKYWEDTKRFVVDEMIPALKNLWENVLSPILSVFKDVFVRQFENIKVLFDDLGTAIDQFANGDILGGITTLISGLVGFWASTFDNLLTGIYNLIGKFFGLEGTDSVFGSIGQFFTDTWNSIKTFFTDLYNGVVGIFTDPVGTLTTLWNGLVGEGGLIDIIFTPIDAAIAWIQGLFGWGDPDEPFKLSTLVKDAFKAAKDWVVGLFTWGANAGTTEAGDFSIVKLVTEAFTKAKEFVLGIFAWSSEPNNSEGFSILGSVTNAFKSAVAWVKNLFTWPEDGNVGTVASKFIDIVLAPYNLAINWLRGLFGWSEPGDEPFSIGETVISAFTAAKDWVIGLFTWGAEAGTTEAGDFSIVKLATGAFTAAKEWVTGLFTWTSDDESGFSLVDTVKNGMSKIWSWISGLFSIDVGSVIKDFIPGWVMKWLPDSLFSGDIPSSQPTDPEAVQGNAEGGPMVANRPYLVGERGPELFIPANAGTLLSNPDTNARLAAQTQNYLTRTNMVQSGSVSNVSNRSGGTTIINAPQTSNVISGGKGGGGRIIPMNVTDNDPTFRAIAANTF